MGDVDMDDETLITSIARRMYEQAHIRSCQWSDTDSKTKRKWRHLARVSVQAINDHNQEPKP